MNTRNPLPALAPVALLSCLLLVHFVSAAEESVLLSSEREEITLRISAEDGIAGITRSGQYAQIVELLGTPQGAILLGSRDFVYLWGSDVAVHVKDGALVSAYFGKAFSSHEMLNWLGQSTWVDWNFEGEIEPGDTFGEVVEYLGIESAEPYYKLLHRTNEMEFEFRFYQVRNSTEPNREGYHLSGIKVTFDSEAPQMNTAIFRQDQTPKASSR